MSTPDNRSASRPSGRHHGHNSNHISLLLPGGYPPQGGVHRAPEDTDIIARIVRIQMENGGTWR